MNRWTHPTLTRRVGLNIQVIAPLVARDLLGNAGAYAGGIVSAHTLGSLIGAIIVAKASNILRALYAIGSFVLGIGFILMAIPLAAQAVAVFAFVILAGVGRGIALTASSTMSATWGESSAFRERLIALTSVIFTASNLVSAAVIALALAAGGTTAVILVCGLGCAAAAIVCLAMSQRWDEATPRGPEFSSRAAQEPRPH